MSHYYDDLVACCRDEFAGATYIGVVVRQPGTVTTADHSEEVRPL
jgi:hypothetical protein